MENQTQTQNKIYMRFTKEELVHLFIKSKGENENLKKGYLRLKKENEELKKEIKDAYVPSGMEAVDKAILKQENEEFAEKVVQLKRELDAYKHDRMAMISGWVDKNNGYNGDENFDCPSCYGSYGTDGECICNE